MGGNSQCFGGEVAQRPQRLAWLRDNMCATKNTNARRLPFLLLNLFKATRQPSSTSVVHKED